MPNTDGVQSYQLFQEPAGDGMCEPRLPVQLQQDEYEFVRFVPIRTSQATAVLPAYMVHRSGALEAIPDTDKKRLREVSPLVTAWTPPTELERETVHVQVDTNEFLAQRHVVVDGRRRSVLLRSADVHALLAGRTVRVQINPSADQGESSPSMVLLSPRQTRSIEPESYLPVGDMASFLSDPRLPGLGRVTLTSRQVEQLRASGTTDIQVRIGDDERKLLIKTGPLEPTSVSSNSNSWDSNGMGQQLSNMFEGSQGDWDIYVKVQVELPEGYEFILVMPFVQSWKLLGYTRGELVSSIPLAAQQETVIEHFTWDRRKSDREQTTGEDSETVGDVSFSEKPSVEVLDELTRRHGWGSNGKVGVQVPVAQGATLGGDFGGQEQGEVADVYRETAGLISDLTVKAAAKVKSSKQMKVVEHVEEGFEDRQTRKIKNHNLVRDLQLHFFEILANYEVATRLDRPGVRLGVLVDNLLPGPINRYFVLQHEAVLTRALSDDTYKPGFGAARLLDAFDRHCEIA